MHGLAGDGVFAVQDPELNVNPAMQDRHTESLPDSAQEWQFDREEHTEPTSSHAFTPEENMYEVNPV